MATVNWNFLVGALNWYKFRGFKEVHMPWTAAREFCEITCPDPERAYNLDGIGQLVGSAEQSLLEQHLEGRLRPGRYVALTPCFRRELKFDEIHLPYFMKVELFSNLLGPEEDYMHLLEEAKLFMSTITSNSIQVITTGEYSKDLEINNIEVGSYSSRSHGNIYWSCGTGLAEPRFSMANASSC